jgi:hypothetical protein
VSSFSQYAPEGWSDTTVQTFTGPDKGPKAGVLNDPRLRASITVAEVHGTSSIDEAVRANPPPMGVERLTVVYEQMREGERGRFFERVIRFAEPFAETAVQQSLRIVEVGGKVYALSLSCAASEFKREYESFARAVTSFITGRLAEGGKG